MPNQLAASLSPYLLQHQNNPVHWMQWGDEAVELTLDKMAAGGIRDHIGGGFARYSVDGHWSVPHFEKCFTTSKQDSVMAAELTAGKVSSGESVTLYRCRDFHCESPEIDP